MTWIIALCSWRTTNPLARPQTSHHGWNCDNLSKAMIKVKEGSLSKRLVWVNEKAKIMHHEETYQVVCRLIEREELEDREPCCRKKPTAPHPFPSRNVWRQLLLPLLMLSGISQVCSTYVEQDELMQNLDRPVPLTTVQGVLGRQAMLPCDISPQERDDAVYMVLWFREGDGEPIYK